MKTNLLFFPMVGIYMISICNTTYAETFSDKKTIELPVLEVKGDFLNNTSPEELLRFPGSRSLISVENAKSHGDNEIKDVLRRIPGLISSENNGTGGSGASLNIGVRGLTQRLSPRSTVLLDGIPLSVAPYGQPQLSLAPVTLGLLESIDVIRGGGSVRYGPQNVGGIINFVTRAIPDEFSTDFGFTSNIYTQGDNDFEAGEIEAFMGGKIPDSTIGVALLYGGKHGSSWRQHSDEDIDNIMLKAEYSPAEGHIVTGRATYYNAESELAGGLSPADFLSDPYQSTRPYDEFEGERKEVVLGYSGQLSDRFKLDLKTFYNDSFRQYTFAKGSPSKAKRLDRLPREYEIFSIEGRLAASFKYGELGFGYRYLQEDAHEQRYRRSHPKGENPFDTAEKISRDSDNETTAHALFVDARVDLGNLSITPGLRYEDVDISRNNNLTGFFEEVNYHELLPSVGINYSVTDSLALFFSYNRSFGSVQHLQLNLQEKANSLNPELANSYEIGTRYQSKRISAELTLFRIDFDNQLVFNAAKENKFWENRGETVHQGIELAGSVYLGTLPNAGDFQLYGNYTFIDAESKELNAGNDLEFYSKHVGLAGIEYIQNNWSIYSEINGQSSQFADPKNTAEETKDGGRGIIPGFVILNAGMTYDFDIDGSTLALRSGVKNLLGKEYFTRSRDSLGRGKYISEPRTVYLSANLSF
ncbi:MAG: TonB-dependent siderophore receptor [Methylococcales bacterium]|nr:TonB-dependent siderophore receptor [Methylococcales bacterium]